MAQVKIYSEPGSSNVIPLRGARTSVVASVREATDVSFDIDADYLSEPLPTMGLGGLRLTTAPSHAHQFSYLERADWQRFTPVVERSISISKAVRLASVSAGLFSFLALAAFALFGVVILHPMIAGVVIIGSATFFIMSKMDA